MKAYASDYAHMLGCAMKRTEVRKYVLRQLVASLGGIGIGTDCVNEITRILMEIYRDPSFTGQRLVEIVSKFRNDWELHLHRSYFGDYEQIRWEFVENMVLSIFPSVTANLGRCLDIGCGRGCITESFVSNGYSGFTYGIDAVDFWTDWRERCASLRMVGRGTLKFKQVTVDNLGDWLRVSEKFDTAFLFYVLHHTTDYWAARLIRELKQNLNPEGTIVILEDSLLTNTELDSVNDPDKLADKWNQWARNDRPYYLSVGYDIQVVLDFVAVQLLAGFFEVSMPCNYKLGSEWEKMFKELGLTVVKKVNLGFPTRRDIDVPQAVFVLKANTAGVNQIV